jgi:1-acyl-sn-glycerol-3-phosphate acyltransferase
MSKVCKIILTLMGWQTNTTNLLNVKKSILIVYPHTSNWDFIIGILSAYAQNIQIKFIIKKEWNIPLIGWVLKKMGAIFIDRSKSTGLTKKIVALIPSLPRGHIVFTPEGTRKKVDKWKTGFYYTALEAKLPISLAYINYKQKTAGILETFKPSGDYDTDLEIIKKKYHF